MVAAEHLASGTHGGRVDQASGLVGVDEADHGGAAAGGRGDPGEDGLVVGHEGRPAEQVLGRVPGDGQLREDGEVGPGPPRPRPGRPAIRRGIPLEVADHRVDLAGGHPHSGHGLSLPGALPGLFRRTWGRCTARQQPPLPAAPPGRAPVRPRLRPAASGNLDAGNRYPQLELFILRSQSGNGGETARCDSGSSLGHHRPAARRQFSPAARRRARERHVAARGRRSSGATEQQRSACALPS